MKLSLLIIFVAIFSYSDSLFVDYSYPVKMRGYEYIDSVKTKILIINGDTVLNTLQNQQLSRYQWFDTTIVYYALSHHYPEGGYSKGYYENNKRIGPRTYYYNNDSLQQKKKRHNLIYHYRPDGTLSRKERYLFGNKYNVRYYNKEGKFTSFGPEWHKLEPDIFLALTVQGEYPLVASFTPVNFSLLGFLPIFGSEKNDRTSLNLIPEIGVGGARLVLSIGVLDNMFQLRGHITGTWMNPKDANLASLSQGAHVGMDVEMIPFFVNLRAGFLYSLADANKSDPWRFTWAVGIPLGGWITLFNGF